MTTCTFAWGASLEATCDNHCRGDILMAVAEPYLYPRVMVQSLLLCWVVPCRCNGTVKRLCSCRPNMLASPRCAASRPCARSNSPVPPAVGCHLMAATTCSNGAWERPTLKLQAALTLESPTLVEEESPAGIAVGEVDLRAPSPSASSVASLHDDIEAVLFTKEQLEARIAELGRQIAFDYRDRAPLVLGVLTGAFQFTGDLVRCMEPCPRGTNVNFVRASSYGSGTTSSGQVQVRIDLPESMIQGRHVILVEDIVDTGLTLTRLRHHLMQDCGAASVAIVALLDKKARRKVIIEPDYTGFPCPNEFVVGYGLDFNEHYRTLPYIGILSPSVWSTN